MKRDRLLWVGSAMLMLWIGLLTLDQNRALHCAQQGGRWETKSCRCILDAGRIILQRDIRRG